VMYGLVVANFRPTNEATRTATPIFRVLVPVTAESWLTHGGYQRETFSTRMTNAPAYVGSPMEFADGFLKGIKDAKVEGISGTLEMTGMVYEWIGSAQAIYMGIAEAMVALIRLAPMLDWDDEGAVLAVVEDALSHWDRRTLQRPAQT
jgi:hypothetical protein